MTLQASGPISFQQINVELKLSPTATISLNDAAATLNVPPSTLCVVVSLYPENQ